MVQFASYLRRVLYKKRLIFPRINGPNVIVVASNDNESSQVNLPGFSICVPVPVIRGLTRFLTMAEVVEVEDGVVITSLTVWQFFMKRAKAANITQQE